MRKFCKMLAMLLSVLMIVSVATAAPLSAGALETESVKEVGATTDGNSENSSIDFEYYINDDNTVSITKYTGSEENVVIPDTIKGLPVVSIRVYAFSGCSSLTSISIPDSITSIGKDAFSGCSSLTSINIPDGVTSIGDRAFADCKSLTSITIPDSVTSIGDRAFARCYYLTSITIPDSVTSIGDAAFVACKSLISINVDKNNDSYSSLDGVLFDKKYEKIICYPAEKEASIYKIPDSVTSISDSAFHLCESLTSITIPDSVTSIGDSAFYYCKSLVSITIPDSVTSIGDSAFYYCKSLASVTIPDSVTSIGYWIFDNCTSLTNVTIGNSVTSIGDGAFENCSSLASITVPASVTSIGKYSIGYNYDDGYLKVEGFKILGYTGTAAEKYANENAFEFVSLGSIIKDAETNIYVTITKDAELSVKKLTDSENIKNASTAFGSSERIIDLYNISLTKEGEPIQPDEPATVKIPTGNENAKVYRIETDGTKTDMNAVYDNGYMVFATDHFSLYALVIPNDNVIGDVNGDGAISIADATEIQQYLASAVDFDDKQLAVADTNGDGSISIADATVIQQYLAQLIPSLG